MIKQSIGYMMDLMTLIVPMYCQYIPGIQLESHLASDSFHIKFDKTVLAISVEPFTGKLITIVVSFIVKQLIWFL